MEHGYVQALCISYHTGAYLYKNRGFIHSECQRHNDRGADGGWGANYCGLNGYQCQNIGVLIAPQSRLIWWLYQKTGVERNANLWVDTELNSSTLNRLLEHHYDGTLTDCTG